MEECLQGRHQLGGPRPEGAQPLQAPVGSVRVILTQQHVCSTASQLVGGIDARGTPGYFCMG